MNHFILLFMLARFFTIVQQPVGDVGYVSKDPGVVTQWQQPKAWGSIGLLAHEDLAGKYTEQLVVGDDVEIFDSRLEATNFTIIEIHRYQIVGDRYIENGESLSGTQVVYKLYAKGALVLSTCIPPPYDPFKGITITNKPWGMLFAVATASGK